MDEKRLKEIERIAFRSKRSEEDKFSLRECVVEIRKLREALAFYAAYKNWVTDDEDSYPAAWQDCGQRARDARGLQQPEETEE